MSARPFASGSGVFVGVLVWWAAWFALVWFCRGLFFGVGSEGG